MNPQDLKLILETHRKWLNSELGGICADLHHADLQSADLQGVDLQGADLYSAHLGGADLRSANLGGADLQGANLQGADLRSASLRGANLRGAHLQGANSDDKTQWPAFSIVPEEGQFIAYKCVFSTIGYLVLTLLIPRSAKRTSSLVGRKCRAEKAKVIKVETVSGIDASRTAKDLQSTHNPAFKYALGAWIKPDKFDPDIRIECTNGIHFFMTKKEAREYV